MNSGCFGGRENVSPGGELAAGIRQCVIYSGHERVWGAEFRLSYKLLFLFRTSQEWIEELLDINLITLSFQEPRLERSFRASYGRRFHSQTLLAMALALLLFCLFGLLDWLLYPDLVQQLWTIRYIFTCLPLLGILLLLSGRYYWRYGEPLMALALLIGNLAVVAMTVVIPAEMNDVYVAGLMLIALFGYTVARMRFIWATLSTWAGLLAYNVANILWGDASNWDLIAGNFFCVTTNIMGMVASYSMEYDSRRGFILQQQLRRERQRLGLLNRELQEVNRQLEKQALTDELTGLANRRSFFERLQEEWRRAQRKQEALAVIMIDVDHFKAVNDRFGHQAGDLCLQQLAQVMREHGRRAGETVARLGGEEFAMLLPATDVNRACEIAEDLRRDIAGLDVSLPHSPGKLAVHPTVSCGVASLVPDEYLAPEYLLFLADQALYEAKDAGRNRVGCSRPPPLEKGQLA